MWSRACRRLGKRRPADCSPAFRIQWREGGPLKLPGGVAAVGAHAKSPPAVGLESHASEFCVGLADSNGSCGKAHGRRGFACQTHDRLRALGGTWFDDRHKESERSDLLRYRLREAFKRELACAVQWA